MLRLKGFDFMNLFGISGELFLALAGMIALLTSVFINKDNNYQNIVI